MSLRVFPISGGATHYSDDWGDPRTGHTHAGNDLFGAEGTPVLAVADGKRWFQLDPTGGNAAYLREPDGTTYYYAHLSAFEDGAIGDAPKDVKAGAVIGYLGHTGNAEGTPPHVHFEMHPPGVGAVDPFPFLQRASIVTAGSRGLFWPVVIAGAIGLGAWAYMNPAQARATLRRIA